MNSVFKAIGLFALMGLLGGCATTSETAFSGQKETCQVCRYNHDLACIVVKVDPDTPRVEHNGKTYYFCSDGCKDAFLKKPEKYLPKDEAK